jgi:hypothetical protein
VQDGCGEAAEPQYSHLNSQNLLPQAVRPKAEGSKLKARRESVHTNKASVVITKAVKQLLHSFFIPSVFSFPCQWRRASISAFDRSVEVGWLEGPEHSFTASI